MIDPVTTDQPETVRIEAVPGFTDRWVAHIGPIALPVTADPGGHTLRIRDVDLARWLEFDQPRDIRKLIGRMVLAKRLRGVCVRATVERAPMPTGGVREYQVEEYWLTREQALLVATQSKTRKAWAVTEAMAKVFDGVLDRMYAPSMDAAPTAPAIDPGVLAAAVALAVAQALAPILEALTTRLGGGVIGEKFARELITIPLEVALETHARSKRTRSSLRRSIQNRLQSAAQFTGPDCGWQNLPIDQLARVQRALSGMLREVPDRARRLDAKYQPSGPLFTATVARDRPS